MRLWNYKGEQNSITDVFKLKIPDHAVISITGAGGKTSLLCAWGRELRGAGKRTVITTTTHMAHPSLFASEKDSPYEGITVLLTDFGEDTTTPTYSSSDSLSDFSGSGEYSYVMNTIKEIDRVLDEKGLVIVVSQDPDRPEKVMQPGPSIMEHLYRTADAVLIEADGSRCMPLKWPAPWEPAVPDNTDITVCVAGMSALGRPVSEAVYRAEDLPEGLRRDIVDETLFSAVLGSLDGGQKGARGDFRIFLNQADTEELRKAAAHLQLIFGVYGIQSAWGSLNP